MRADINSALQALGSTSIGTAAPATIYTGQQWVDNDTPSATLWTWNFYDGADSIAIGQFDTTANTFSVTNGVKTNVTPVFTVAINEAAYADVASAGTCDIGAAASNNVRITGTTTITGLGSGAAGIHRRVRFAGILTLTYNATSLILPTSASITTAADDMAEFTSLGSSNWICTNYERKSGAALAASGAASIPVGAVMVYAGLTEPTDWQFCYGQAISRATFAALFAIVSTTYGVGDGSTTFNVPDLRGRVVAGQDDMGGSSANRLTGLSAGVDGDTLGASGGAESHTLVTAELAAHDHSLTVGGSGGAGTVSLTTSSVAGSANAALIADTGSGTAHNNVQPTFILNYIIKVA